MLCSHSVFSLPSGLGRAPDHHHQALAFAQDLVAAAATINMAGGLRFSFAIGLHTGPAQVRRSYFGAGWVTRGAQCGPSHYRLWC